MLRRRETHHRLGFDRRTCAIELLAEGVIRRVLVGVFAPPTMEVIDLCHGLFLRCRRTAEPFQSSTVNPGTRWNSLVLWVTSVSSRALAWPAIKTS